MNELVRCGLGLGNRVAAIANGLSRWPAIRFVWRDNKHCPATHEEVFPRGVEGVEFATDFPMASASRWDGFRCHSWHAAGDRNLATSAYRRIMDAMSVSITTPATVAILARFHRFPDYDASALARDASRFANGNPVFIMADSRRDEIAESLHQLGVESILPKCPPLKSDMDRRREDVRLFIEDWHMAYRAKHLVSHGSSSLGYPMGHIENLT